jgi:hypothetical protein
VPPEHYLRKLKQISFALKTSSYYSFHLKSNVTHEFSENLKEMVNMIDFNGKCNIKCHTSNFLKISQIF